MTDVQDENSGAIPHRKLNLWAFEKSFENIAELEEFFCEESQWKRNKTTRTFDGTKVYYYCSQVNKKISIRL